MNKLQPSQMISLIAAIEDSILLAWKRQSRETAIQLPEPNSLPRARNPQAVLDYLEDEAEFRASAFAAKWRKTRRQKSENDPEK
jgi:hypothetical protein